MKMKKICELCKNKAIETIKNEKEVFVEEGCFNKYVLRDVDYAIKAIKESGYGADVDYNEKNGKYYILIPNSHDMW